MEYNIESIEFDTGSNQDCPQRPTKKLLPLQLTSLRQHFWCFFVMVAPPGMMQVPNPPPPATTSTSAALSRPPQPPTLEEQVKRWARLQSKSYSHQKRFSATSSPSGLIKTTLLALFLFNPGCPNLLTHEVCNTMIERQG